MKYTKSNLFFIFSGTGNADRFPYLAAFKGFNRADGDPITADYMELLEAHLEIVRRSSKRRKIKRTHKNYFRRKHYASSALD